jgi:adenylyltransferase/sulfurtransferase
VIAPAVHAIAGVAAAEGIKVLAGRRDAVARRLITLDVWSQRFHAIEVERDPACPCCAKGRFDFLDGRDLAPAAALCGRDAVHIRAPAGVPAEDEGGASGAGEAARIDLDRLARRLQQSGDGEVRLGPAAVRFKAGEIDATFFADGRAIVKGTGDVGRARAFYARWIGV